MKPSLLLSAAILCGCSTQQPVEPPALVNVAETNLGRSGIMFGGNTNEVYRLETDINGYYFLRDMRWYPSPPADEDLKRYGMHPWTNEITFKPHTNAVVETNYFTVTLTNSGVTELKPGEIVWSEPSEKFTYNHTTSEFFIQFKTNWIKFRLVGDSLTNISLVGIRDDDTNYPAFLVEPIKIHQP